MGVSKVYLRSIWAYISRVQRKSFLQLAIRHFNYPQKRFDEQIDFTVLL